MSTTETHVPYLKMTSVRISEPALALYFRRHFPKLLPKKWLLWPDTESVRWQHVTLEAHSDELGNGHSSIRVRMRGSVIVGNRTAGMQVWVAFTDECKGTDTSSVTVNSLEGDNSPFSRRGESTYRCGEDLPVLRKPGKAVSLLRDMYPKAKLKWR